MAEEHRCQAPRLCVNNCGFFGSPTTENLCSKCYRDLQLKEQQSSSVKIALDNTLSASSSSSPAFSCFSVPSPTVDHPADGGEGGSSPAKIVAGPVVAAAVQPSRCLTCKRRVGITGFKCRCGSSFCGTHRYPDQHGCSFDFKSMDREAIAKANPVVKGQKLDKI